MILSKSDYMSGVRCEKKLWLEKRRSLLAASNHSQQAKEGIAVGKLARFYFPEAQTVALDCAEKMAEDTKGMIASGVKAICEATFVSDGCSCSSDIVLVHPDGLDVIEVKSSTTIKSAQVDDMAFQCHVIQKAGYKIRKTYIMHINKQFVKYGDIDPQKFFSLAEIPMPFHAVYGNIANEIQLLKKLCARTVEPPVKLGCHCDEPYTCPFKEYCFKQACVPKKSVFDLPGMPLKKCYDFFNRGVETAYQARQEEMFLSKPSLKPNSKDILDFDGVIVNIPALQEFLDCVKYPVYHLDFETIMHAIPPYDGIAPYEQIPFQFSVHVRTDNCHDASGLQHFEFLGNYATDYRYALAKALCESIPAGAHAMAYNSAFEKMVLRSLARQFPDLAAHLTSIADGMIDLMIPFRKRWVTSADMFGSYSIKAVLPALCKSDMQMDYSQLEGVHNGVEAMDAFLSLGEKTEEERLVIRENLKKYCGLDTMAMDKILNKLLTFTNKTAEERGN